MNDPISADSATPVQLLAADGGTARVVVIDVEGGDARLQFDGASVTLTKAKGSPLKRGQKLCLMDAAAKNSFHGIGCSPADNVKFTVQTWPM